ncbi:hypothetical protein AGMMS49990_04100 [Endomicrobiia bacterium]|nr:hypothetical protein AGMMS49990_04100 [Endomicrobiia bacterium]
MGCGNGGFGGGVGGVGVCRAEAGHGVAGGAKAFAVVGVAGVDVIAAEEVVGNFDGGGEGGSGGGLGGGSGGDGSVGGVLGMVGDILVNTGSSVVDNVDGAFESSGGDGKGILGIVEGIGAGGGGGGAGTGDDEVEACRGEVGEVVGGDIINKKVSDKAVEGG